MLKVSRSLLILVVIILLISVVVFVELSMSNSTKTSSQTLRVGYPDALDEGDIQDLYAYKILSGEGVNVVPTYYVSPPLAYEALVAGQQDIAYDESGGSFGLSGNPQDTTCVGGYMLSGTFLAIAGDGVTKPSQMIGKTSEDFGPGTIERYLNEYWFRQAGIPFNNNAPDNNSVFLMNGRENAARVHDLENGVAQEIVIDDFVLADFESPSINNTANGGPYHVLFYSPENYLDTCYVVRDNWLSNPSNQLLLEKYLAALYEAQRWSISNPQQFISFAEQQLPSTPPSEIQFASTFYSRHFTYWPYGLYNLQGDQNVETKFNNTNTFYLEAGVINTPILNSSVSPYGIINKYFELRALQIIGPYSYPNESWVNSNVTSDIQSWVPSWMLGTESTSTS